MCGAAEGRLGTAFANVPVSKCSWKVRWSYSLRASFPSTEGRKWGCAPWSDTNASQCPHSWKVLSSDREKENSGGEDEKRPFSWVGKQNMKSLFVEKHILKEKPCCVLEQVACKSWSFFACCFVQDGWFVYLTIQTFCWGFLFSVLTCKNILHLNLQLPLMTWAAVVLWENR